MDPRALLGAVVVFLYNRYTEAERLNDSPRAPSEVAEPPLPTSLCATCGVTGTHC